MLNFKDQFANHLEQLKKNDSENDIFGSGSHEYEFGSKLSESDILDFEQKNSCKLPEPYKIFLTEFGNGGAGPSYGVFALGTMDSGWDFAPFPDYIKPAATFRFTEAFNNDEMLYEGEPQEEDFAEEIKFEDAHERWYEEVGDANQYKYYEDHSLDGAIPICHHGCGFRSWLVVDEKSPEFGNIWEELIADNLGVEPAKSVIGSRINFADWILEWCVKSTNELKTQT